MKTRKKERKNKKEKKRNIRHREYVFEFRQKQKRKKEKKRVPHKHWRDLLSRKKIVQARDVEDFYGTIEVPI
jgi:hypothetical protein